MTQALLQMKTDADVMISFSLSVTSVHRLVILIPIMMKNRLHEDEHRLLFSDLLINCIRFS